MLATLDKDMYNKLTGAKPVTFWHNPGPPWPPRIWHPACRFYIVPDKLYKLDEWGLIVFFAGMYFFEMTRLKLLGIRVSIPVRGTSFRVFTAQWLEQHGCPEELVTMARG